MKVIIYYLRDDSYFGAEYESGNKRKKTLDFIRFLPIRGFFLTMEEAVAELKRINESRYILPKGTKRPGVVINCCFFEVTGRQLKAMQKVEEYHLPF